MRRYDTTFIIDGTLSESDRLALIEKSTTFLKRQGAEIDQIVRWGMRTLAYQINKRTHGYFVIFYYRANPNIIALFERELRLNENVLRYMTLIFDGKHPEYIRGEGAIETAAVPEVVTSAVAVSEDIPVEMDEAGEIVIDDEAIEEIALDAEQEEEPVQEKENE
jgi:small subunit ribosomal protein S6